MKKVILVLFCLLFLSSSSYALENEYSGIGTILRKDGNKTFVIKVLPNSSAAKVLLQDCTQILEVNGQKTNKMTLEEITSQIKGKIGTNVNLLIKENNIKKEMSIERNRVILPEEDPKFVMHWQQVAPEGYISMGYFKNSKKYSVNLQNQINIMNYWEKRKETFKIGYNACLSYPEKDQSSCLMNLVNREIQKTENQKQIELQQQALQQQARQNFVNTMNQIQTNNNLNNINNTLQQQNMRLYNINHSINHW